MFPGLRGPRYRVTSAKDDLYNCIAWAAGVTDEWWWPFGAKTHWPSGVTRALTPEAFQAAFATLGYEACEGEGNEVGFQKVALFADPQGKPTHAARQLSAGRWTSKLGRSEDIEHELHDLAGTVYGAVVLILKRPVPEAKEEPTEEVAE